MKNNRHRIEFFDHKAYFTTSVFRKKEKFRESLLSKLFEQIKDRGLPYFYKVLYKRHALVSTTSELKREIQAMQVRAIVPETLSFKSGFKQAYEMKGK